MKVACIGSREITPKIAQGLFAIGKFIAENKWMVVSGNALGSDEHYALGANSINPNTVKLFVPWGTYNSELFVPGNIVIQEHKPEWAAIARRNHPIYDKLTQGAKKMMDRNAAIILESDVVLAVLNHKKQGGGGTGHGWRVAEELKKPAMDLSGLERGVITVEEVKEWLKHYSEHLQLFDKVSKVVTAVQQGKEQRTVVERLGNSHISVKKVDKSRFEL